MVGCSGFDGKSALLGHEMAYCLGQIDDVYALPILQRVLENEEEHPMVRHEVREQPIRIEPVSSLQFLWRRWGAGRAVADLRTLGLVGC